MKEEKEENRDAEQTSWNGTAVSQTSGNGTAVSQTSWNGSAVRSASALQDRNNVLPADHDLIFSP